VKETFIIYDIEAKNFSEGLGLSKVVPKAKGRQRKGDQRHLYAIL
jgi:hypothetical protein